MRFVCFCHCQCHCHCHCHCHSDCTAGQVQIQTGQGVRSCMLRQANLKARKHKKSPLRHLEWDARCHGHTLCVALSNTPSKSSSNLMASKSSAKVRPVLYYDFSLFLRKSEDHPMVNTHILVQGFCRKQGKMKSSKQILFLSKK